MVRVGPTLVPRLRFRTIDGDGLRGKLPAPPALAPHVRANALDCVESRQFEKNELGSIQLAGLIKAYVCEGAGRGRRLAGPAGSQTPRRFEAA
jgi:hypothetical protein